MPTRVPGRTAAPGFKGTAPTRTSGSLPASHSDATTLWLASVPLLHGMFRPTAGSPAWCRVARAAAIFTPMTLGTITSGCVVAVVDVVSAAVVVVVRTAFFDGEPPQDERTPPATKATAPAVATRTPRSMEPSLFPEPSGRVSATPPGHFKMLTARATTRIPTTREIADSAIIMSFAQIFTAETSVGLKAAAVANAKWK